MSKKFILVIPAYEPPMTFVPYAQEVATHVDELIVVNDGSSEQYDSIFQTIEAFPNGHLISYRENKGKGYALRQAFAYAKEHFDADDILVTADCDGQHVIKDVIKVYKAACEHKDAYVLGSRDFNNPNVPARSRGGNRFMHRAMKLIDGVNIYDTQTGLRASTIQIAEYFLSVKGNRFEFETNTLIYCGRHQIPIVEVIIDTVYIKAEVKEQRSHFRAIRDSARVLWVLLKSLDWYMFSSILSSVIDIGLFYLLINVIFPEVSDLHTLIATVGSRVVSSLFNFYFNFKYVFFGQSKRSIIRYYIVWFVRLILTYVVEEVFYNILGYNAMLVKVIAEIIFIIITYYVSCVWIFKSKRKKGKHFGKLGRFARSLVRTFKKKYRNDIYTTDHPKVYVCRHLNTRGPITVLANARTDLHPMVLNCFATYKECYNQYTTYTFTKRRGKKEQKVSFKAAVCAFFVHKLVRSVESIPVYRKENKIKSIITFRKTLEFLQQGESVIVFPDIDYTGSYDTVSDIYDGFLFVGEMYKKRTGEDVEFVPLYLDDVEHVIWQKEPVLCSNYDEDKERAKAELMERINRPKE